MDTLTCDLCGETILNPARDAIGGEMRLDPLIIRGQAARHSHLSCYRLNAEMLARGLDPGAYATEPFGMAPE